MSDNSTAAQAQHAALGLSTERNSEHTNHPEAQWFPSAGLGLFIHWGIAAVAGNLDLSWSMMAGTPWDSSAGGRNKTTPEQYWKLAEQFKPSAYDPDRWLQAASAAGFQYAVMTTMHHDGYTLWPTKHGDLGVQSHLGGRDLVGPFVEACRRHGLKVGLYYSPPDWFFDREYMSFHYGSADQKRFPGRPHFDIQHKIRELSPAPATHVARRREFFHARVRELLTRYGRIDLLWFDGGTRDNEVRDLARSLQPHLVINSRSCDGDFDSTECSLPKTPFTNWLETCHCWQHSDLKTSSGNNSDFWGYLKEEQYKSTAWMLESLVRLRAWGGNFLVNVGPRPNGELPEIVYRRLAETSEWMKHSKDSVLGTSRCPSGVESSAPVTCRGNRLFLHALPSSEGQLTVGGIPRPESVQLLRTGRQLAFSWEAETVSLSLAPEFRTGLVDVVVLDFPRKNFLSPKV